MVPVDVVNEKQNAESFLKYKTYCWVRANGSNYNGYILQVTKNGFLFKDDLISGEFPISFSSLDFPIVPSLKKGGIK